MKILKTILLTTAFSVSASSIAAPMTLEDVEHFVAKPENFLICVNPTESFEFYEGERLYAFENNLVTRKAYHFLAAYDLFPVIDRWNQITTLCPAAHEEVVADT